VDVRLAALILSSSLVTLDGTAATLALPAIARTLETPATSLHWISDAPLLMLALLLLPAGGLADRRGQYRVLRVGLLVFASGAIAAALVTSTLALITARAVQGVGAACMLPPAFAVIRAAIDDPARQARKFGVIAAWTGAAAVIGPLLGGLLADAVTWRAVFLVSAGVALTAFAMLWSAHEAITPAHAPLLPPELLRTRNCVAANVATFGLYFGVFGLPFIIVIYLQEVLEYSALAASLAILPLSVTMFLAAPFAKLSPRLGGKRLVGVGSVVAAAGAVWMAWSPSLPFWAIVVIGTALFGLGVSMAVSPLTQAAVAGVGESCAGAASALNHAVVRAAGLVGIALLGSIVGGQAADGLSIEGFRTAMSMCGVVGASCGLGGALLLKDDELVA
jgi:MFS family permease